jgi:hypothetical protein
MKNTEVSTVKYPTITELKQSVIKKEGKVPGLKVQWISRPKAIVYPTGLKGYRGTVQITAPGYNPTTRNLLGDSQGWRF